MRELTARRRPVDADALLRTGAPPADPNVHAPALVRDAESGEPVLLTVPYGGDVAAYRRAALTYTTGRGLTVARAGGIRNIARVFGYMGRNPTMRRQGCRACAGATEAPAEHAVIAGAAATLAAQLRAVLPERAAADAVLVQEAVKPDWLMSPDAWWSSGVVNRTSPMAYHRDGNNFRAWSAMVVVRRMVRGGHLHVPEYDLVVNCRDGDVVYFAGWDLIHGVTAMQRLQHDGYRVSAVYYPVRSMERCLPFAAELDYARGSRTEIEHGLVERQRALGTMQ